MPPKLHAHQETAVEKLGNGKVLVGGVGTGKSITAVAYYVRNESPRNVYVITTAKKRNSLDWEKEFAGFAIGKTPDATVAGLLTVDSWNNIGRYTDVRDAFFIFDEQRAVGSGAWADAIVKIARSNRWIMLSATPGDTWLDFVPLFLANGFYKNRTAFVREHVEYNRFAKYPKVERYHGVGKLVRYKNQLLVEMPYERHTRRIVTEVVLEHDSKALERVYKGRWNIFEEKPVRDIAELFSVARRVVNSSPSRLEYVRSLMEKHPRLIVFYNFDYELEMLRTLVNWTSVPVEEPTPTSASPKDVSERHVSEVSSTISSTIPLSSTEKTLERKSTTETNRLSYLSVDGQTASRLIDEEAHVSDASISETERTTECHNNHGTQVKVPTPTPVSTTSPVSSQTRSSTSSSSASAATQPSTKATRTSTTGPSTSEETSTSVEPESESSFQLAEWNGHKHQEVPETDRWVYLVQYTAGSEGWNCITTDTIVFWSLTYSYKAWHQSFGRIDRLNTPFTELHYYVLQSNSWIDDAVRRSLREKKNFNENKYRLSNRDMENIA